MRNFGYGPVRSDGYDYDGDWEEYNAFFQSDEIERQLIEERERIESAAEDKIYRDLALAEEERERAIAYTQENEYIDHNYDIWDDYPPDDYCPNCGCGVDDLYDVSTNHEVCACSPLYPDIRPRDLSHYSPCLCNVVVYEFLGETICRCTSPDLYALLERQYILRHGHKPVLPNQPNDVPF